MALVVNSNISSLNAQRQLLQSGADLDQASSRLASGLRINSAADDAAGLAISNRQTSQIRGLDQAIRNANDGISLIQTAEGALEESGNILQRMRELAVQSSNGIYTDTDRATLDAEVQQLVEELDRIAETTSFNGQNLLDGSLGEVDLQVGAEAGQTISFSIDATSTADLGLGSSSTDLSGSTLDGGAGGIALGAGDVLINGQGFDAFTNTEDNENLDSLVDNINENVSGVTASAFNVVSTSEVGNGVTGASSAGLTITLGATDGNVGVAYEINNTNNLDELVSAINEKVGGALVAALDDEGKLTLSNTTGAAITVAEAVGSAGATGITPGTFQGSLSLTSDDGSAVTITKGSNGTDAQLSALGFNEVQEEGQVLGSALGSAEQSANLEVNTLSINGVSIAAETGATGTGNLQGKVDNINDVTSQTGVVASIVAEESFTADVSKEISTVTLIGAPDFTTLATIANDSDLLLNGVELTDISTLTATSTVEELAGIINDETVNTGVTATVGDNGNLTLTSETAFTFTGANNGNSIDFGTGAPALGATVSPTNLGVDLEAVDVGSIKINGTEVEDIDLNDLDAAVLDINAESGNTGVVASIDDNGELQFKSSSAITLELGQTNGAASALRLGIEFTSDSNSDGASDTVTFDPRINLESTDGQPISVDVTGSGATNTGLVDLNTDISATVTGSALSNISVATAASAQSAIESIDTAIESISDTRSQLGAINNRLDFTVSNLGNISERTSAARSQIVDADFAAESASLSRAQVLQQASQAMLAQANARPQQVLSLLQ